MLLNNTTGKDHITVSVGDEDHIALMAPVTLNQGGTKKIKNKN